MTPDPTPETKPAAPGQMIERPEAGSYGVNLAAANTMFISQLDDRPGKTEYVNALSGEHKTTSMWMRNQDGHNTSNTVGKQLHTHGDRYVLQMGGELIQRSHNGQDRWQVGVMGGYGTSRSTTSSRVTGYRSKGTVDGYSVGMYGTWFANDADKTGAYVDIWAQYGWFNNAVNGQEQKTEKYNSRGLPASVEGGYTFKIGEQDGVGYFIQPKAQTIWMGVNANDHREANGTNVTGVGNGNIQTRLGVRAYLDISSDSTRAFQPFIEANWIHNSRGFGATLDGVQVKRAGGSNVGELEIGAQGQLVIPPFLTVQRRRMF